MIVLPISKCSLELISDSSGWTNVYFIKPNSRKHIGAEAIEIIQKRLIENICNPNKESSGIINGHEVFWVLSFSEKHHTLYASKISDGWQIYLQDSDGNIYWSGILSQYQYKLWENILKHA